MLYICWYDKITAVEEEKGLIKSKARDEQLQDGFGVGFIIIGVGVETNRRKVIWEE